MADPAAPKVVMVTSNAVVGDSRVQKAAWSAANAGYDTVVVGTTGGAQRLEDPLGLARVVRVPAGSRWQHRPGAVAGAMRLAVRGRDGLRRRAHRLAVAPGSTGAGPRDWLGRALWAALVRDAAWRRTQPQLVDLERALVPVLVAERPDLIHAHDYSVLQVAVAAADAVAAAGAPRPKVVYDAHELLRGVRGHDPVWRRALLDLERACVRRVDAVLTVSDSLADFLVADFCLAERPTVVLNAPVLEPVEPVEPATAGRQPEPSLRDRLGLPAATPLLVYAGAVAPQRGLATLVEALPQLPGVHAALVAAPGNRHVAPLRALAERLGVAGRLHVTPYVRADQVSAFLASATAGVIPILHYPNHEIALITKYFEYAHARLPIIVSNVTEMGRTTRALGNGEIFEAGDASALAAAARVVVGNRERYAAVYTGDVLGAWTWQRQVKGMLDLYARLAGAAPAPPEPVPAFADSALAVPMHRQETR